MVASARAATWPAISVAWATIVAACSINWRCAAASWSSLLAWVCAAPIECRPWLLLLIQTRITKQTKEVSAIVPRITTKEIVKPVTHHRLP